MKLNAYQKAAMQYSPGGHDRIHYGCMGLIGESGEVVDVVKKHIYREKSDQPYPTEDLIGELGDVMWYLAELATGLGLELESTLDIGFRCPTRDGEIEDSLEKAAVRLAEVSIKCYTTGLRSGNRRNMTMCMKRIYAIVRRIAQMADMPIENILFSNIEKQKKRYPYGYISRK